MLKAVKLRELMDRLAEVASAKWVQDGGRYRLERPSELEAELRAKEIDRLAGLLKTQIDKQLKELEDRDKYRQYQFSDQARTARALVSLVTRNADRDDDMARLEQALNEYETTSQMGPPSPSELLLLRTLSQLNLKQIASIAPGGRLVLSTQPNAMQRSVAVKTADIEHYNKARDEIAPTLNGLTGEDLLIASNFSNWPRIFECPIAKCLLMVDRHSLESKMQFELRLLDPRGEIIDAKTAYISWAGAVLPDKDFKDKPKIQWSSDSLELIADDKREYDAESKISKDLRNRLNQPDVYDPLSTIVSDLFFNLADEKGKNLVGSIPDAAMCFNENAGSNLTIEEFERGLGSQGHVTVRKEDRWLTVKPMYPIAASYQRIDREALGTCLRANLSQGYLQLLDKLRFARNTPYSALSLLSLFCEYVRDDQFDYEIEFERDLDWLSLQFAAWLTPAQWQYLKSGYQLPIRSLQPNQRAIVEQLLFGYGYGLGSTEEDESVYVEPTEAFPYGIPSSAYICLKLEPQFFAFQKLGRPPSDLTYIPEFADGLARGSNKLMAQRFYLGYSTDCHIGYMFSDELSTSGSFTDTFYNQTMRPILPSQFPWEYRQAIQKEAEKLIQYWIEDKAKKQP